jgi:hypothetical protein
MAAISYAWGQRHYPIPYDVGRVLAYMAFGVFLWWACEHLPLTGMLKYGFRMVVLAGAVALAWRMERNVIRT